jgi:hypothetical protein
LRSSFFCAWERGPFRLVHLGKTRETARDSLGVWRTTFCLTLQSAYAIVAVSVRSLSGLLRTRVGGEAIRSVLKKEVVTCNMGFRSSMTSIG